MTNRARDMHDLAQSSCCLCLDRYVAYLLVDHTAERTNRPIPLNRIHVPFGTVTSDRTQSVTFGSVLTGMSGRRSLADLDPCDSHQGVVRDKGDGEMHRYEHRHCLRRLTLPVEVG